MSESTVLQDQPAGAFVLPGWDDEPALERAPERPRSPFGRRPRPERAPGRRWLLWLAAALVVVVGAGMIVAGLARSNNVLEAPLPASDIDVSPDVPVRGPDGISDRVEVETGKMSIHEMGTQRYFIPSLGAYSYIYPMDDFSPSRYEGFDSLDLPANPADSGWFSQGGSLSGNEPGSTGTTLIASHVSGQGRWGALSKLYSLSGGELVYVTDAEGTLSAWKVTKVFTQLHTTFPPEFFAADGPRQLVLTTCGAYDSKTRSNTRNIFAVAVPVDPLTGQPFPEEGTTEKESKKPAKKKASKEKAPEQDV